jgi:cytochrome b561
MAQIDPSRHPEAQQYTATAKSLHWLIVGLLIVQYILSFEMPDVHRGVAPEGLIGLHLSFGVTIILLMLARLAWRLTHPAPPPPEGLPSWQLLASRWTHFSLYLLLFLVPVIGLINAQAHGFHVTAFGILPVPEVVPMGVDGRPTSAIFRQIGEPHILLSYVLLGVAGLHVLGALYHRLVLRDRVLARMLPGDAGALAYPSDEHARN